MIFIEMMLELVMDMEVDKVADEVANMEVDMEVDWHGECDSGDWWPNLQFIQVAQLGGQIYNRNGTTW